MSSKQDHLTQEDDTKKFNSNKEVKFIDIWPSEDKSEW